MSPIKRLYRRLPPVRWLALRYVQQVRDQQHEARQAEIQLVLTTVGNITIGWAGVERMLDELIASYQLLLADRAREHPRSLSVKLKYLKMMQQNAALPDGVRDFLRSTRIEAKRLDDRRHDVIHGLLHRLNRREDRWRTQRVTYDGARVRLSQTEYCDGDLQKLSREISLFGHAIAPKIWIITRHDRTAYPASDIEKALRELGMT